MGGFWSHSGRCLVAFLYAFPHDSYWEAGGWGGSLGWPGGGLDRSYYPGTTRELPGIWAGCVGVSGLAESARKEFGQLAKNIAAY